MISSGINEVLCISETIGIGVGHISSSLEARWVQMGSERPVKREVGQAGAVRGKTAIHPH